ncbi:selenocysteine-specific translation elongation factor [Gordonia rhizosphera]|uniref:Selenocysteine-specific elongation factor n=1 Tax=Gordonia rhizosphera NBRC 16068 TaxID=1108045 RepID=K6WL80_9ACTN|nr:selenocysteine-specific translation elongation factor [Gordonia rhizosphera]GAB92887.1 selenocysteine-specific elongation factor [Gordonia rhizosphera NBRC 16068]
MFVLATAGHVDHGKSTLVRALTGIEPDRWAEERRRGLTIDLGFAWTTLPSGADVAFVDVPGHERFLPNTLAGLGPAPTVMFVVAADDGWQAQSSEHRDVVTALGVDHGLIVLAKSDRVAAGRLDEVATTVRAELAHTGLADAPMVAVSATTGTGLDTLRATIDDVLRSAPPPPDGGRVRLWVDRAFSVTGAGTVVTGTLTSGRITVGDTLDLLGEDARTVTVRGLQSEGRAIATAGPVSRVAANLRGVAADDVWRGMALVSRDTWRTTTLIDLRRVSGPSFDEIPARIVAHLGTASLHVRLRPLGDEHARLTLDRALPLTVGDRIVLRDPGSRLIAGGLVLDTEPPEFRRRGDASRRATALHTMTSSGDLAAEVNRRGAVPEEHLRHLGLLDVPAADPPHGVRVVGRWWLAESSCTAWAAELRSAVTDLLRDDPLTAGLSHGAARDLLGLPDDALVAVVAADAGLESVGGHLTLPVRDYGLGPAEDAVVALERRLAQRPFHAPEADDLSALGLGPRELAAAERTRRLLRLRDGVVLLPSAPAQAMRTLVGLEQPFTTSTARQALGTTRRVVIPLLEHLDARGWTRRLDAGHREVVR